MVSTICKNVLYIQKFITDICPFTPCLLVTQLRIGTAWLCPLVSIRAKDTKCPRRFVRFRRNAELDQTNEMFSTNRFILLLHHAEDVKSSNPYCGECSFDLSPWLAEIRKASLIFIFSTSPQRSLCPAPIPNTLSSCAHPRRRMETRKLFGLCPKVSICAKTHVTHSEERRPNQRRRQPQPTILFHNLPHT